MEKGVQIGCANVGAQMSERKNRVLKSRVRKCRCAYVKAHPKKHTFYFFEKSWYKKTYFFYFWARKFLKMTPIGVILYGSRLHAFPNPENASLAQIQGQKLAFGSEYSHFSLYNRTVFPESGIQGKTRGAFSDFGNA
jgi:hypothetical protein